MTNENPTLAPPETVTEDDRKLVDALEATPPLKRSLLDITNDMLALLDLLAENDGEITPEVRESADEMIAELQTDEGRKLDGIRHAIAIAQAEGNVIDGYLKRYRQMRNAVDNTVAFLKDCILRPHLERTGQKSITTPERGKVWIQANGGTLPILPEGWTAEVDPYTLPDSLCITERKVDHEAVRAELEAGVEFPFARLGERGSHVRVK